MPRDYSRLLADLSADYERHAPTSAALNRRATQAMVDGGSHALRLIRPFPPRIARAQGGWVWDEDGNAILDFWQGHHANLLGHNPPVVREALAEALQSGWGLQTGFTDRLQIEAAELLLSQTGAERVRFTTSGALATMYAILLARLHRPRAGAEGGRRLARRSPGRWWASTSMQAEPTVESAGLPPR
jgi:glutamate-1-semialdehyde 2,1-aminomutase